MTTLDHPATPVEPGDGVDADLRLDVPRHQRLATALARTDRHTSGHQP